MTKKDRLRAQRVTELSTAHRHEEASLNITLWHELLCRVFESIVSCIDHLFIYPQWLPHPIRNGRGAGPLTWKRREPPLLPLNCSKRYFVPIKSVRVYPFFPGSTTRCFGLCLSSDEPVPALTLRCTFVLQHQSFPQSRNSFKVGMKLEGLDPCHPSLFCVLTVAEVRSWLSVAMACYEDHLLHIWFSLSIPE